MKKYNISFNVGTVKYVVNFHDGMKTHKDGSPFYDLATFRNKKKMSVFVQQLLAKGYNHAKL
jgi:hypothetical protein